MKPLSLALLVLGVLALAVAGAFADEGKEAGPAGGQGTETAPLEAESPLLGGDPEEGGMIGGLTPTAKNQEGKRPFIGAFGSTFTDKDEITVQNAGVYGGFTAWDALKVRLRAYTGLIHQNSEGTYRRQIDVQRTALALGAVDLYVTPHLIVWGTLAYDSFNMLTAAGQSGTDKDGNQGVWYIKPMNRGDILGGRLGAKYVTDNTSEVGAEARRLSVWSDHDRHNSRAYSVIINMTRMPADLAIDKLFAYVDLAAFGYDRFRLEGVYDAYDDGNRRKSLNVHYLYVLPWSTAESFTVVRPNVQFTGWEKQRLEYFSPAWQSSVGVAFEAAYAVGDFLFETEVAPGFTWMKDNQSPYHDGQKLQAYRAIVSLSYKFKGLRVGICGFATGQSDEYWTRRGSVFLKYTF